MAASVCDETPTVPVAARTASRQNRPPPQPNPCRLTRVPSIFQLLISVADTIRVHQRNASKACTFDYKSNKKASPNINKRTPQAFPSPPPTPTSRISAGAASSNSASDVLAWRPRRGLESKLCEIKGLLSHFGSRPNGAREPFHHNNFAIGYLETFMARAARQPQGMRWRIGLLILTLLTWAGSPAWAADEPDLIFRRSTVFKLLTPNDKLATYGIDDPVVEGVACHFTVPERGGVKGWLGIAEEVSDISLACRQIGPIHFKGKMAQGEDMFRQRRSVFFKKMQIVRGCDAKRNVLVYMVYSDKLIEGSPKNSTSSVPVMPWGPGDATVQKCGDFIE